MNIHNIAKSTALADNCKLADRFTSRFLGLMCRKVLLPGSGLIIVPCNSIHMFFMRFPLDIIFIDKSDTVVFLIENIKPWRFSRIVRKAHSVIELPAGIIHESRTEIGDILKIE